MRRFVTPRRTRAAFLMLIAAAVAVLLTLLASQPHGSTVEQVATIVLVMVQAASLIFIFAYPERAMVVSLAAGIGLQVLWPELGVLGLANLSLCAFAALRPPRVSLWALAFMLALAPWPAATRGALAGLIASGGPALSWSWGELLRTRRDRRRGEVRRASAEERARIARELHDVVAHNVSLIVVQAVAADDVFDTHPDQARDALRAIESSGRAALAELRRLLGTVRPDAEGNGRDPQPGLAQLDALVASVRGAGVEVAVHHEGTPVPAPAGVDLSAYRIVQEALTNTMRHARAKRAVVTVRYTPGTLEVEVQDDGRGAGGEVEPGHGIVGMQERVALLGGTLQVGPGPHGGFRVRAALPLGAPA